MILNNRVRKLQIYDFDLDSAYPMYTYKLATKSRNDCIYHFNENKY